MKKRSCRMTASEKTMHETAVRVRKMTDSQLCEFIEDTYQQGKQDGMKCGSDTGESIAAFIQRLDAMSGTGNGIGKSTVYKLRKFAEKDGLLNGV